MIESAHDNLAGNTLSELRDQLEEERAARQRAEASLAHCRESLSRTEQAAHVGHWNWNIASNHMMWSDEAFRLMGAAPQSIQPSRAMWLERTHADDRDALNRHFEDALTHGHDLDCDYRVPVPDAPERWVRLCAAVTRGENGQALQLSGTLQDVSALRAVEGALQRSEDRFRAFMDNSPVLAFIKDEAGQFTYVNHLMEMTFDVRAAQKTGLDGMVGLTSEMAARMREQDALALSGGHAVDVVATVTAHDGTARHWLVFKFPILDDGRRCIGGVAVDVTDRRNAEQDLQKANEQLQAVLDAVPGGVSWINSDGTYIGVNAHLAALHHLPSAAFTGQPVGFLNASPEFEKCVRGFFAGMEKSTSCEVGMTVKGEERTFLMMAQKYGQDQAAVFVGVDITESKRVEAQLRHGAYHDTLTNLPNRMLFLDRLRRVLAESQRHPECLSAVLFIDFDHFKVVNDSLGHEAGDQLLISVARRLEGCLRPGDTVARLGGDEFVILLEDIRQPGEAMRVAGRIQQAMVQPFELVGHEWFTAASIGIAFSRVPSGVVYERAEDMLRDADTAMYRAKLHGRARYEVFDVAMHAEVMRRLQLETDLRYAIERGELFLHYQPIMSLRTGEMAAVEALVRWQHPQRGLLLPNEFIPLAEESGLILNVDRWVLGAACRQMRAWQTQSSNGHANGHSNGHTNGHADGSSLKGLKMMVVNLSSRHFSHPDLTRQVSQSLEESGLDANRLKLEITEGALASNSAMVGQTLARLRQMGVSLSMDDFGTGYSSLSDLPQFQLDTLKIDRSFVARMSSSGKDEEIVRAIVSLGHNLGIDVVASGVETDDQLNRLRDLKCEYAQGYLFSRADDGETIGRLMTAKQD